MKLRSFLLSVSIGASLLAFPAFTQDGASLQAALDSCVSNHKLAGISAAIGKDGNIWWSGGAGHADIENEVPMSGRTVHRIASISKPMAAVGALLLVEQGKLRLDDTARQHVAAWPEQYPPLTVYQLLSHTSGIRHYKGAEASTMTHYPNHRIALRAFKDDALLAQPGEKYIYTTYGYTLLGAVIESAAGEELHPYLARTVWSPAGMLDTTFEFRGAIVPRRARGYSRDRDGQLINANYTDLSVKYAGGGMLSTAEDLVRFGVAFQGDKLVSAATRATMLTPAKLTDGSETGYGLGWNVGNRKDDPGAYTHSGGQDGTSTHLAVYPETGLVIAVICNVDGVYEPVSEATQGLRKIALASLTAQGSE